MSASERPAPATGTGPSENPAAAKPPKSHAESSVGMAQGTIPSDIGRLLAEEGAQRAAGNADAWWWSLASTALDYLRTIPQEFTADNLWLIGVPAPDHPNRVGGLFMSAHRRGEIKPVGYRTSTRTSRHAGVQRVWVGVQ